jgi:hypothetical protein
MTAMLPERGQIVLGCQRCGNPAGERHAPGCTPKLRREYALLQFRGASDRRKAEACAALSAAITVLSLQISELDSLRDDLARQVWGCTWAEALA